MIKAYRFLVQCKCKLRGLFAANQEGGNSYIFEDMKVCQALSYPGFIPFADQNLGKILDPLQINDKNVRKYVL